MPTHYQGTTAEILALDTFIKLSRANNSVETQLLRGGRLGKLTMTQFAVLEALFHLGSLCQGDLSKKLLKSTGNMTLVLDNLEKAPVSKQPPVIIFTLKQITAEERERLKGRIARLAQKDGYNPGRLVNMVREVSQATLGGRYKHG